MLMMHTKADSLPRDKQRHTHNKDETETFFFYRKKTRDIRQHHICNTHSYLSFVGWGERGEVDENWGGVGGGRRGGGDREEKKQ